MSAVLKRGRIFGMDAVILWRDAPPSNEAMEKASLRGALLTNSLLDWKARIRSVVTALWTDGVESIALNVGRDELLAISAAIETLREEYADQPLGLHEETRKRLWRLGIPARTLGF